MPYQVSLHQLEDLAHLDSKNETIIETNLNTRIQIESKSDLTIISLHFGNRIDIINNRIIIHEK